MYNFCTIFDDLFNVNIVLILDIFTWIFSEVTLNHLWKRTISTIINTGLLDKVAVAPAVALIKHSAYANEILLPSWLQVSAV